MILYIEEILHLDAVVHPSANPYDMSDTAEEFNSVKSLLDSYAVHHMIDLREDATIFSVYAQKVTLDEFAMNDLFYNVLSVYFNIDVRYANYGGKGCGMALTVTSKKTAS